MTEDYKDLMGWFDLVRHMQSKGIEVVTVKVQADHFQGIAIGHRNFLVTPHAWEYKPGQVLWLRPFDFKHKNYHLGTGVLRRVTSVQTDEGDGLDLGYVCLGLEDYGENDFVESQQDQNYILQMSGVYADMGWLECDGLARVLHYAFTKLGILHRVWHGQVFWGFETGAKTLAIPNHYWLTIGDKILDYRVRYWLGQYTEDPEALTHGLFDQAELKGFEYMGKPIDMDILDDRVYYALTYGNEEVFADQLPGEYFSQYLERVMLPGESLKDFFRRVGPEFKTNDQKPEAGRFTKEQARKAHLGFIERQFV